MFKKIFISLIISCVGVVIFINYNNQNDSHMPLVAIANYGPHSSLEDSIKGFKEEMIQQGFIENKNVRYKVSDVSFDSNLIQQMIVQLKILQPDVILTMTTPVAQAAKNLTKNIPLVFSVITDPVEAGLLNIKNQPHDNMTGASDEQNFDILLNFARNIIPNAHRVGVFYATSEANDIALVKMIKASALKLNMQVIAVAIDQPRDIPIRIQFFKDKVDFIYVGTSGPIQPTLPAIIAEADKMNIPIFNANEESVKKNQVLASFGVDYIKVGSNAAKIVAKILRGEKNIDPIYPLEEDHHGFVSQKRVDSMKLKLPHDLTNVTIIK